LKKTRSVVAGAVSIAAVMALAACSSSGSDSGSGSGSTSGSTSSASAPKTIGTVDGSGKTLTVWAMQGDYTDPVMKAINSKFEAATGAKVKVVSQAWDGIGTKLTTALSTSTPPDVIDIGNTQVAGYAATGGLADLTDYKTDLEQGGTWLGSLEKPSMYDGKLYAVPSFVGNREVIYNKTIWKKAGITSTPTSYAGLKSDLDKIKAKNSGNANFSSFYLPGQFWYAGLGWVLDADGDIATESNGTWTGGFSSAASQKGLTEFKSFQNTYSSKASQSLNTDKPNEDQVMADGNAATMIGAIWDAGAVITDSKKKLKDSEIGTFAMPGQNNKLMPNFGGGEVWGVAAKSQNQDLALAWTKIAAGPAIQKMIATAWIPNTTEGAAAASAKATGFTKGFYDGAGNTFATPASPNWATIEGNKTMENLFSTIANGSKSVSDAAKTADDAINSTLNAAS
jgi:N,N'-diacetylchitobiose transport system substrate-binding protein